MYDMGTAMTRTILRDNNFVRVTTLPGWAVAICAVGFAVLGFLVLLLGAAFLLLLAPVAIGALLFARWRLRRFLRDVAQRSGDVAHSAGDDPRVIDADYTVVREKERF
jgi:hypothetical protein